MDDDYNQNQEQEQKKPEDRIDDALDIKDNIDTGKDIYDKLSNKKSTDPSKIGGTGTSPASPTSGGTPPAVTPPPGGAAAGTAETAGAIGGTTGTAGATGGAAAGGAAAGTVAGGAAAGGTAAGGAAAGAAAALPAVVVIIIIIAIIVLIVLIIGTIISLYYLPGTLVQSVKDIFKSMGIWLFGEDAMIDDEYFSKVANYIQNRGYDLYGEGYINKELDPEKDLDDSGQIKQLPKSTNKEIKSEPFLLEPHLIELYTRMDAYTYRIRNKATAQYVWPVFTGGVLTVMNPLVGVAVSLLGTYRNIANHVIDDSGFLNFYVAKLDEQNKIVNEDYFSQGFFKNVITVSDDRETLNIKKSTFGGTYFFQMDGWSGRYGMPLEFFITLHQGTRSPDLVRELAKGTETYKECKMTENKGEIYLDFKDKVTEYDYSGTLFYKKPVLNILLLETEFRHKITFEVPENTTVNGEVYVLNGAFDFDYLFDIKVFDALKDEHFVKKTEVTWDELYKTFIKVPNLDGTYKFIRIYPKKTPDKSLASSLAEVLAPTVRDINGVPIVYPYQEVLIDGKIKYRIREENYDLRNYYFEFKNGVFKVKNQSGVFLKEIANILPSANINFIDEYGLYNMVNEVRQVNDEVRKGGYVKFVEILADLVKEQNEKTYIPFIKNSEAHWFRDVYFFLDAKQEYVEEDSDYFLLTNEHWAKYDLTEEDGKKILTPKMISDPEPWMAYDIKDPISEEEKNALGYKLQSSDPKHNGISNYLYINEVFTNSITQKEEGRRGMTNARTKNLFANVAWYKYDGSRSRADLNRNDRKLDKENQDPNLKTLIEPNNDLMAAFEILEGSRSLDAQYILRDLKEFYVELGYYQKEDLRDPVRRILRWPIVEYNTPKEWPAAVVHQDPDGYGVYIPAKSTLEKMYDEETLKKNKDVVGEGFEPDMKVISPVTGRIEEIGTKTVTKRLMVDKDGNYIKVPAYEKEVGYITISAIDKNKIKDAPEYEVFYENEYKQVIAGKVKHGKQSEDAQDSRYLEGNKITIEGFKVEIPSNVNDKSNSFYTRQLKKSAIAKVQNKQTREEAEAIEQSKINAPNYISISGSNLHVGDYIKEGTVIGFTLDNDIRIVMRDVDKAFIENVDHYFVKDLGFHVEIMDDYYTVADAGEPNIVEDIETFKYMFQGYKLIQDNAQVFLDIQEKYGINAVFAACVAIEECSGGNATEGINKAINDIGGNGYNNIFSIKYNGDAEKYVDSNGEEWNMYPTIAAACNSFARLITKNKSGNYWDGGNYYVDGIGTTYSGNNWSDRVNSHMTNVLRRAQYL